jgi:hypothetical protein
MPASKRKKRMPCLVIFNALVVFGYFKPEFGLNVKVDMFELDLQAHGAGFRTERFDATKVRKHAGLFRFFVAIEA